MKIEKLGTEFTIPIKDAIEQVSDYEVKNGDSYKKVLDEKVIPYEGKMYLFKVKDKILTFTPWHICNVVLDDMNEVILYASDVQEGMKFKVEGMPEIISEIKEFDYNGYVYGFEVEGMKNKDKFIKAEIIKNYYDDGSVAFVLDKS